MIRAYIDIDGVLIRNGKKGPELIPQFPRIIRYLKKNFDCYWLSTHTRSENGQLGAKEKLAPYLKKNRISPNILNGIKSTDWRTLKTEAIDFDNPFIWLEDHPLQAEYHICTEKRCLGSIVEVNWEKRSCWLTISRLRRIRRVASLRLR